MSKNSFLKEAMYENHPQYQQAISRNEALYQRKNDLRSPFSRDYNRIIFSLAYRRLKHKTQVFFAVEDDHVCTRSEHVNLVDSVSYTIAHYLGLNTELTRAIAVGHDLGHAPFGHGGEKIINQISKEHGLQDFWHEKNSLYFVDQIETLEDDHHVRRNLNLTYAVRDGIISHCGEMNQKAIIKRNESIDLKDYLYPGQYNPYTWEGCVVKISDKISYIGRDIEDAISLGILENHLDELYELLQKSSNTPINNTVIINYLVSDLCKNSTPELGLHFSDEAFSLMNKIKTFNYLNIYTNDRLKPSVRYFNLVINEIYDTLKSCFDGKNTINNIKSLSKISKKLSESFIGFVYSYYDYGNRDKLRLKNKILFDINSEIDFYKCILFYISGMTDNFAIEIYNDIIGF